MKNWPWDIDIKIRNNSGKLFDGGGHSFGHPLPKEFNLGDMFDRVAAFNKDNIHVPKIRSRQHEILSRIGSPLNDGDLLRRNQSYAVRTGFSKSPAVLALLVKAEPSGTVLDSRHRKPASLQFCDKLLDQ